MIDPHAPCEPHNLHLTNEIIYKGKAYALSLQGTLVDIDVDSKPKVTSISRTCPSATIKELQGVFTRF